ncbi:MAG: EAL domain-containing protein [Acidimicrobiia bacterium]
MSTAVAKARRQGASDAAVEGAHESARQVANSEAGFVGGGATNALIGSIDTVANDVASFAPSQVSSPESGESLFRQVIDSLEQPLYLLEPEFHDGRIVDLLVSYANPAAVAQPFSGHITAGVRASEIYLEPESAYLSAEQAWAGSPPEPYLINRKGLHEGSFLSVFFEVTTLRVGDVIVQLVADRTKAHDLEVSESRFRAVIDSLHEALLIMRPEFDDAGIVDLRIAYSNYEAPSVRGTGRSMIGRTITEVFGSSEMYLDLAREAWTTCRRIRYDIDNTDGRFDPSLESEYLEIAISRVGDELISVATDRSTEHRARREVEASAERYRRTVEGLSEGLILFDTDLDPASDAPLDLRVAYANPAAQELFGAPRAGQPLSNLVSSPGLLLELAAAALESPKPITRTHNGDALGVVGRGRILEITAMRSGRQVMFAIGDRTGEVQAQQRFRLAAEGLQDPILVLAPDRLGDLVGAMAVRYANPAATAVGIEFIEGATPMGDLIDDITFSQLLGRAAETGSSAGIVTSYSRVWEVLASAAPGSDGDVVVVLHDVTEREQQMEQLEGLARHDPDTGLLNAVGLSRELDRRSDDPSAATALVVVELAQLEQIQRVHGYRVASDVVREVAERLSNTAAGRTLARVGGATFAVLLDDVRRTSEIKAAAEAIVTEVQRPVDVSGLRLRLEASAGVALASVHGNDTDQIIRRAKTAAWFAMDGRRPSMTWSAEMEKDEGDTSLLAEVDRAMAAGEFYVDFQPKLRLADNTLAGAEALVRWRHPHHGLIGPSRFIALVEESTLVRPFTEHVLQLAASGWRSGGNALSGRRVAVNLPVSLVNDPALVDVVTKGLEQADLPPDQLELEITERGLVALDDAVHTQLGRLRDLGVLLNIDDFGTGAASLSYLRRLPVNQIKIDQSFVRDLDHDRVNRAIVQACVTVAGAVELQIVAEGIETELEAIAATELGCHFGQGFHLGRPGPLSQTLAHLHDCS